MNRHDNKLDQLFAQAKAEPPVVRFDETRARLQEHPVAPGSRPLPTTTGWRHITMTFIGFSIAATLVGLLAWGGGDESRRNAERMTLAATADSAPITRPGHNGNTTREHVVANDVHGSSPTYTGIAQTGSPIGKENDLREDRKRGSARKLVDPSMVDPSTPDPLLAHPLATLDGGSRAIAEVAKGKVTIVSFWATWCKPCQEEMKAIDPIYREWQAAGEAVEYVAVSIDDEASRGKVERWIASKGYPFPVLLDPAKEAFNQTGVVAIPHLRVYDTEGNLRFTHNGFSAGDEDLLRKEVAGLAVERQADPAETIPASSIGGVRFLELEPLDLGKLGLQPDEDGVWWFFTEGSEAGAFKLLTQGGVTTVDNPATHRKGGTDAPDLTVLAPVMVTDGLGNRVLSVRDDNDTAGADLRRQLDALTDKVGRGEASEAELSAMIERVHREETEAVDRLMVSGQLVPILVRTERMEAEDDRESYWGADRVYWYEPTQAFLAALPEEVRLSLERELRLTEVVRAKSEREAVGVVTSLSIYPNPASDHLYIRYRLNAARRVSVAIYDISGALIRRLAESEEKPIGHYAQRIDLAGFQSGVYMLAVSTGKGERIIERIVVER